MSERCPLYPQKRTFYAGFYAACPALKSSKSLYLCGDFNDVPDSPVVRAVLDSNENFRDVFAGCHPGESGFTYSPKNRYVEPSWTVDERIDYIFANGEIVPKDCSVVFDGSNGLDLVPDHFGVFGNLAFR